MSVDQLSRQSEDRERVRDASDIVRVVGEHVTLKPKGREFVGLCPFHDDHTPSMNVVPRKQIFHCFSCGAGGDVFSFIQRYHRIPFPDALRYLAERSGIELTRPQTTAHGPEHTRTDLLSASATAHSFFRTLLGHERHGRAGRDLIESRGISREMVDQFELGVCPDRPDGLLATLRSKGLDLGPYRTLGLVRQGACGERDGFRNRLMFPIFDRSDRVIAFGARRLDEADERKYLNSPESSLFKKSETLYALPQARRSIQRTGVAVVCEGYTDAIACHQAGLTNVVATLGTALTPGHAFLLRHLCRSIVLLFDGDEAGQRAADRAVEVLFAEDMDIRIATLSSITDAKDPDELLRREDGAEALKNLVAHGQDLLRYRFGRLGDQLDGSGPGARHAAIADEIDALARLGLDRMPLTKRTMIIREITRIVSDETDDAVARSVTRRLRRVSARSNGPTRETDSKSESASPIGRIGAGESFLGCVLCEPALWDLLGAEHRAALQPGRYPWELLTPVAQAVFAVAQSGARADLSGVLARIEDTDAAAAAVALQQHVQRVTDDDPQRMHDEAVWCLREVERRVANSAPAGQEPADAPDQPRESVGGALERIERRRKQYASLGPDGRAMPRPGPR